VFMSRVFSAFMSSPLLHGLKFVRFLDEATVQALYQSRPAQDYGKKRLELAHVRLQDYTGRRLLADRDVEFEEGDT